MTIFVFIMEPDPLSDFLILLALNFHGGVAKGCLGFVNSFLFVIAFNVIDMQPLHHCMLEAKAFRPPSWPRLIKAMWCVSAKFSVFFVLPAFGVGNLEIWVFFPRGA